MSLMSSLLGGSGGVSGDTAQLQTNDFTTQGFGGTAYSGVQFNSNGDIYERQYDGGWSRIGTWLASGTNTTFYLRRTINSGTLSNDDGGSVGDLRQMNTSREYDVLRTTDGEKICYVDFTIVNSADNVVYANRQYMLNVIRGAL